MTRIPAQYREAMYGIALLLIVSLTDSVLDAVGRFV